MTYWVDNIGAMDALREVEQVLNLACFSPATLVLRNISARTAQNHDLKNQPVYHLRDVSILIQKPFLVL